MKDVIDRVWDVIVIGTGMGGGTAGRALAETNIHQEPHNASDHLVAKGIGPNVELQNSVPHVFPMGRLHTAAHGVLKGVKFVCGFWLATKRRKIVIANDCVARKLH